MACEDARQHSDQDGRLADLMKPQGSGRGGPWMRLRREVLGRVAAGLPATRLVLQHKHGQAATSDRAAYWSGASTGRHGAGRPARCGQLSLSSVRVVSSPFPSTLLASVSAASRPPLGRHTRCVLRCAPPHPPGLLRLCARVPPALRAARRPGRVRLSPRFYFGPPAHRRRLSAPMSAPGGGLLPASAPSSPTLSSEPRGRERERDERISSLNVWQNIAIARASERKR